MYNEEQVVEEKFIAEKLDEVIALKLDDCETEPQDDSLVMHATIVDEVVHEGINETTTLYTPLELSNEVETPLDDGHVENKRNDVFKSVNNDDSLPHIGNGDTGGFGFVYETKPMERDAYDDFSPNELESDLFKKETTHEEHGEHLFSKQSDQPFYTWDSGVLEPKNDKGPHWDEFPFGCNDVLTLL